LDFFEGNLVKGLKTGLCRCLYSNGIFIEGFYVKG